MSKQLNRTRRVSTKKLRNIINDFADIICGATDRVTLSMHGNHFEIHLDGGSINITVNEPATDAEKGGQG